MQEVPVDFSVILGTADLSLTQLARLAVGDMVILDQPVAEPLLASVGGDQKFRGWAGRVGNQQAYQIQSVTDKP
jgi:flagellar motor switch protein FliM